MASTRNLEQGLQAVQRRQLDEAKRLLKFALKTDPLSPQERVTALVWLAECDNNPQFKVEQYEQALQIEPTNQDVINRLSYWRTQLSTQLPQQGNTPSQGMQSFNPNQQNFQQGYTPSQGNPPYNPNQQNFQQGYTPSQGNPAYNPNQQAYTPSQGMPPYNPNQGYTPSQGTPPYNPNPYQQGTTPVQGIPPLDPNQQNFQQGYTPIPPQQQQFQQGFTPTGGMPPINQQNFQQNFTTDSMRPIQQPNFQSNTGFSQPPLQLAQVQRSVGILDGPNGRGTGFFIARDGLIATTRYVVGGEERVTVELMGGQRIEGRVVRSFPDIDLAFVQANVQLAHLLTITQNPVLPDNIALIAVTHTGDALRTSKRATKSAFAQHWIPTVINHLLDAGGNPIFVDGQQNALVGMLTKNAGRANGYMFGLHVHKIYQMLEQYMQEKQRSIGKSTSYCNSCGIQSHAPSYGGFFCENCGSTLSYAVDVRRYPQPNLSALYGENLQRPCPNCASQVGFYNGKCLRCGFAL
jgi:hypothetical protein